MAQSIHVTALLKESIKLLQPLPGMVVVDGTVGGGGFAEAALERIGADGLLLGLDRDADALARARTRLRRFGDRFIAVHAPFSEIASMVATAGLRRVDIVMLDIGISSDQLDDPERGFSFMREGPLDMRMDRDQALTAAELVNTLPVDELADVIYRYGEERHSRRIARAIERRRRFKSIRTTTELAGIVRRAVPHGPRQRIHPATRTFQALRIAVNDELGELEMGLEQSINVTSPGGRIGVISFHSLEDKTVKRLFHIAATDCVCPPRQPVCTCAHRASLKLITSRPARPAPGESSQNPRARSARLRVAEKLPD